MSPYRSRAASRSPPATRRLISAASCESLDSGATGAGAPAAGDEARRGGVLDMNYGRGKRLFTAGPTIQGFAGSAHRGTMPSFPFWPFFNPQAAIDGGHARQS